MATSLETLAEQVRSLDVAFDRLEARIENMLSDLKGLFRNEILELKTEQLADLRKELERVADDQRRLWDAVRALERRESEHRGGFKAVHIVWTALLAAIAAGASVLIAFKH